MTAINALADLDGWISPAYALAHACPEFWEGLSDVEKLVAAYDLDTWLRPEQRFPTGSWRSCLWLAGRGFGKTIAIAYQINQLAARSPGMRVLLAAPTLPRVVNVQIRYLTALSPPWFRADQYDETCIRWPNGATAIGFCPEAPGRPRSENADACWETEIVDWNDSGAVQLHRNLSTATRKPGAIMVGDTTSRGMNDLIQTLLDDHKANPRKHRLIRGSMRDNFALEREYIESQWRLYPPGSQEHAEEIEGETFAGAAGASWDYRTIAACRVAEAPAKPDLTIVSVDPALSKHRDADAVGCVRISRDARGHCYVEDDLTRRMSPEEWATLILDAHAEGAAGAVIERNHVGDFPHTIVRVLARERGLRVEVLDPKSTDAFPPRRVDTIWIREVVSEQSKITRHATAATLYARKRAHHCGAFRALEQQMVNWTPGQRSPNALDALSQGLIELAGLRVADRERHERRLEEAVVADRALRTITASGRSPLGLGSGRRGLGL